MSDCTCPRLALGLKVTEARNWNPDCPEHGRESEGWNSDEQQQQRQARREQLTELWRRAREARRACGRG